MAHVQLFQPRFCARIMSGEKRHTIRRERKRPIRVGERLSLRRWSGKPYRSPQEVLAEAVVTSVSDVLICCSPFVEIEIDGVLLGDRDRETFAREDGFESSSAMGYWHGVTNALPFHGVLIRWQICDL